MASLNSINLIRTKTSVSPQIEAIEASLRRTGLIGLIAFVCVGFVIGVVYFIFVQEKNALETTKASLVQRVSASAQKEAIYLAIKDRVKIVGKAIDNQKPWYKLLDRINGFILPPELVDVAVDEQNKITMTIQTSSLETELGVVNALIAQANNNEVLNPQLVSFSIGTTGKIQSTFTFLAVF